MKLYTFALDHKINILSLRPISERLPRSFHSNWACFHSNKKDFLQNVKCSISMENGAKNTKTPCVKNTPVRGYKDLKLRKPRG